GVPLPRGVTNRHTDHQQARLEACLPGGRGEPFRSRPTASGLLSACRTGGTRMPSSLLIASPYGREPMRPNRWGIHDQAAHPLQLFMARVGHDGVPQPPARISTVPAAATHARPAAAGKGLAVPGGSLTWQPFIG